MAERVVLMVLDSVGIGALPDAHAYGDAGSDTLGNIIRTLGTLNITNLIQLGLGNIIDVQIPWQAERPLGAFGKAVEASPGKDTTTGHWEIGGIVLEEPFPVYPEGFPKEVIIPFEQAAGHQVLWNKPASGSEIILRLGEEHAATGRPIVYTSADSVFQIAAHEEVVPLETLYRWCTIAREILQPPHEAGRVIARPFTGTPGQYVRTKNRRDFSLVPPRETILTRIRDAGMTTAAVGKIEDIFAGVGITRSFPTKSNQEGLEVTLNLVQEAFQGLIFTNLVDFDMLYGHRNDTMGYGAALEAMDRFLPCLLSALRPEDVLIITADHGCDPTTESTDHSREYVPVLVYGQAIAAGTDLGVLSTFSDIGATVLDLLGLLQGGRFGAGCSFMGKLKKGLES